MNRPANRANIQSAEGGEQLTGTECARADKAVESAGAKSRHRRRGVMTESSENSVAIPVNPLIEETLLPVRPASQQEANDLVPTSVRRRADPAMEIVPPPVLSAPPTPWTLLLALRRRWLSALTLGLAGAVAGAIVTWLVLPISWRARTLLHISSNRPFILFETPEG